MNLKEREFECLIWFLWLYLIMYKNNDGKFGLLLELFL